MSAEPRNLCVLFADIAGSTRLYEKLGDAEALRAVERCLNRMERATAAFKGRVVKTLGDELMVVFDSAEAALLAASEMQQRIAALPPVSGVKLAIRVGFHFGPALEEKDDVFGDTVNVAARVVALAKAGQTLLTAEAAQTLPAAAQAMIRDMAAMAVKGKDGIRVFEAIWGQSEELTMLPSAAKPVAAADPRLRLRHGDRHLLLGPEQPTVSFGRDTGADIVIKDARASRSHGHIERRRDKFVLVDQSTNGTYVTFRGEPEFMLRREEAILRGRGRISFGHAFADDGGETIEFEVL